MESNLEIFRRDFINANTWPQRKDGVPLDLLDKLTEEELSIAENELLIKLGLDDTWPIIGLGYIRSELSLPILYELLSDSSNEMKITIAHSIYQISGDEKMIDIVLEEIPKLTSVFEIIDVLYLLPSFKNVRVDKVLHNFCNHKEYLVAYNATRLSGLSVNKVIERFRKNGNQI